MDRSVSLVFSDPIAPRLRIAVRLSAGSFSEVASFVSEPTLPLASMPRMIWFLTSADVSLW